MANYPLTHFHTNTWRPEVLTQYFNLTLSNSFFSQELLSEVDVFQHTVLRQNFARSLWFALK